MNLLKSNIWKKILATMLTLSIVVLAGCQAILGVDFNQALKNSLKVTSVEGNSTLQLKLDLDEALLAEQLEEDDMKMLKLLSSTTVSISNMKVQNDTTMSFNGNLSLGDETSIDFDVKMTEKLLVFSVEGAKQPFSFDLTGQTTTELANKYYYEQYGITYDEYYEDYEEYAVEDEEMIAAIQSITDSVINYSIDKLPNVERIKTEQIVESINGVDTNVLHVHGELKGMEVWSWAKKLVDGLLEDRTTLEKMLTEVVEIIVNEPSMYEYLGLYYFDDPSEIEFDEQDKAGLAKEAVQEVLTMLDELKQSMIELETEDKETLQQVLNNSLDIGFDYFIDSKLDVRKQKFSLQYTISPQIIEDLGMQGLKGFSLVSESESWNVNGNVVAEQPKITNDTVSLESLDYLHGYEIIRFFNKDSLIYDFLKNTVRITEQTYWNYVDEEDPYAAFITKNHVMMIPIKDIVWEFGGSTTYNGKTKEITVFDDATDTTIVMKAGSNIATVDGEKVQWNAPVVVKNGISYAPVRGLASALQASALWDSEGYIEISREL